MDSQPTNRTQEQLNRVFEYYRNGRLDDAEKLAISITQEVPSNEVAWKALWGILQKTGKTKESLTAIQKAAQLCPSDAKVHYSLGWTLLKNLRLGEAEKALRKAIALKPDYAEAHHYMGVTMQKLNRFEEAEANYLEAIASKPRYFKAYLNLGITFTKLGKFKKAEKSFRKATETNPDSYMAHLNLAEILYKQGNLKEAESSYRHGIALNAGNAAAYTDLGIIVRKLGRWEEALSLHLKAISLKENFTEAYRNLSIILNNINFKSSNRSLYPVLLNLLKLENEIRPEDVAFSISSLLKHDPLIKDFLPEKNIFKNLKKTSSIIEALNKLSLLHHLMRICALPDLELEQLFAKIRFFILINLDKLATSPALNYFLSTLSLQCFINEYVYFESKEETKLVFELEALITESMKQSKQPELKNILCLASYRQLHKYKWCKDLEVLDHLDDIKKILVEEPLAEKAITKDIAILGEISDKVSNKVREQYEENPFPRWVKTGLYKNAKSIAEICGTKSLKLYSENIKEVTYPKILVAGCGTGQHSLQTASRFTKCHVTAVDLSLASLAYAKRKTVENKFTNIDYLQADIINLDCLGKKFDIIESVGVLHHMSEPMLGWRVLTNILKPGGLMNIGLYSELARQDIVSIRNEIKLLEVGTSDTDMRQFRQSMIESSKGSHQRLAKSPDFFSLSTLRDLIFHVQEHRFTLPQIANCLEELGLKFCGFENKDIISDFRIFYKKDSDIYDLELWHKYEENSPKTFGGMYQFWCQKL